MSHFMCASKKNFFDENSEEIWLKCNPVTILVSILGICEKFRRKKFQAWTQ